MKKLLIIFSLLVIITNIYAQAPSFPGVQSPNASSLGTFGSIPVNYFTGTPDISIPIYTMKSGNITLPISLRYHPANVKPNDHPGWVGLGWNLQCYGVITRAQHSNVDEFNLFTGFEQYYPEGAAQLTGSDWNTQAKLKEYFIYNENDDNYNVFADEFYFNFLNYSGKFIWTADGWAVVSDQNIKVEIPAAYEDAFVTNLGNCSPPNNIQEQMEPELIGYPEQQSRMFKEFILTTDDGTKYIFGGESAIEYTTPYGLFIDYYVASAWYLKKIISITNDTIEFNYHRRFAICKLAYSSANSQLSYSCGESGPTILQGLFQPNAFLAYNSGGSYYYSPTINTRKHGGSAIFPVYLSEIVGKNDTVSFKTSYSHELRYPDEYLKRNDETDIDAPLNLKWLVNNDPDYLQWEQLDSIIIKDKNDGSVVRMYKFNYSSSSKQRLTLNSMEEIGSGNYVPKIYSFKYNNVASLPPYGGDKTDHWGYYNGRSVIYNTYSSLNPTNSGPKSTNPDLATTGLLTKITYPTKGYTEFDWEANYYNKIVSSSKIALDYDDGHYTGGSRIKEIRSFPETGAIPVVKKYYYVLNYTGGDPSGLSSSGILNGRPKYAFALNDRTSLMGECVVNYRFCGVNPLTNYSCSAFGSHIGYSEVIEMNADGSYTKYKYTNFGPDEYGISHFDKPPLETEVLGWSPGQDIYIPTSKVDIERGKPTSISHYNNANQPIEKINFYYDNSSNRFDKYVKMISFNKGISFFGIHYDNYVLASAYKIFTYRYNLTSKSVTTYDVNGLNPITDWEYYTYNNIDQIRSKSKVSSKNETITQKYLYPTDYPNTSTDFIVGMENAYIINKPIETYTLKNDRYVLGGTHTTYKTGNSLGLVDKVYSLDQVEGLRYGYDFLPSNDALGYPLDDNYALEYTADHYDSYGNILQYHKEDDINVSYIWGYNNSYPVAKIVNATYNNSSFQSFESGARDWGLVEIAPTGIEENKMNARTGRCYYKFFPDATAAVISSRKLRSNDYKVSFWAKKYSGGTQTMTVSGSTSSTVNIRSSSWTYYELDLSTTRYINFSCNGYVYLDDVRIHPANAQMETYTYKPLVGMTSHTDANNVTIYYEYDSFGRLYRVLDDDRNVLKQYGYNFAK